MNNFKELLEYSKTKKPTVIYVKNIAASAAYEPIVGMEIFAHETSEIGSIGLWFIQTNFTELHKHLGIKRKIITTNSELEKYANKNHPEYKSFLEEWLKVHAKKTFYDPVLEHRNIDHKHLNGEVWYGEKAKKYNFIDHIISHI
ncbi:MAG: S49 family peptidase, partial [Pseudomonadota bacterium]